jgi:hypothetical protein
VPIGIVSAEIAHVSHKLVTTQVAEDPDPMNRVTTNQQRGGGERRLATVRIIKNSR